MKQPFIAWLLFGAGSVIALICAAKLPNAFHAWPDSIAYFLPALGWMGVGLILLLWEREHEYDSSYHQALKYHPTISELLDNLVNVTLTLEAKLKTQPGKHLLPEIQHVYDDHLLPFQNPAIQAQILAQPESGARTLDALAYGERLINRVTTTLSDGYEREARKACFHARKAFSEAARLWKETLEG